MVFIPLSDDNPLRSIRFQWVTVGLIAANVLVFLWQSAGLGETAAASFALVPSELFQVKIFGGPARGPLDTLAVPEGYTLLTYMFLHGDIFHLDPLMRTGGTISMDFLDRAHNILKQVNIMDRLVD